MEEVINKIMEFIRKNTEDFTYMDQQLIYDDLAGKLSDMSVDALKSEYINNNLMETENE
jgi:hypothetical protein